jgi:hypothetical protein
MSDPFIPNLTNKSTPVAADLLIIADSQDGDLEKNTQIGQVIVNNNLVATSGSITTGNVPALGASNTVTDSGIPANKVISVSGTYASGNLPVLGASNEVKDSGISVDVSQNLTNVGNINGIAINSLMVKSNNLSDVTSVSTSRTNLGLGNAAIKGVSDNTKSSVASTSGSFTAGHIIVSADTSGTVSDGGATSQFLKSVNNLSDVSNAQQAFNTIAPSSASQGDIIYFDGTNWVRLGIAATNYILSVSAGGIPTWQSPGSVTGFTDNAVFKSTASTILTGGVTPTNINLGVIDSSTSGNSWTLSGDGFGMKCGTAGSYSFNVSIPYAVNPASSFGIIWSQLTKNNTPIGPISPLNIITNTGTPVYSSPPIFAIIPCAVNDVIRLTGASGQTIAPTVFYSSTLGTGANVLITRLT